MISKISRTPHFLACALAFFLVVGTVESTFAQTGIRDRFSRIVTNPFKRDKDLEESARPDFCPGGLAILPSGDYVMSCHQFYDSPYRVLRQTRDERWVPFPNDAMNSPEGYQNVVLDSVLGIAIKGNVVWMVDNGRRGETTPKLVAWDLKEERVVKFIPLGLAAVPTSHFSQIALDPEENFAYLTDPASGPDAALVVVDLSTGIPRRVLAGHSSVVPEPGEGVILDGRHVGARRADGKIVPVMGGASPIAIGPKGRWLYFGPKDAKHLYRVETKTLRDPSIRLTEAYLQTHCSKPICDSIAIDAKGVIYFGDIQYNAIGYYDESGDGYYHHLTQDPRLIWPGGLLIGPDEKLHFFSNQLHRTRIFQGDKDVTEAPFSIFRAKPYSTGMFR